MAPNKEGWWLSPDGEEVEIYRFQDAFLAAWCDDVGIPGGPDVQTFTDGDDACGHIPAYLLGEGWTFLREFGKEG